MSLKIKIKEVFGNMLNLDKDRRLGSFYEGFCHSFHRSHFCFQNCTITDMSDIKYQFLIKPPLQKNH